MWWPGLGELRRGLGVVPESPGAWRKSKEWLEMEDVGLEKKMKKASDQVLARIYCNDCFPWRRKGP